VRNKAQKWVLAALNEIVAVLPFDALGIDSDNGSEFINNQLLRYCQPNKITYSSVAAGQQERLRARGGEELVGGAPGGRLPSLRHRTRTVAAQRDLRAAAAADQLLLPQSGLESRTSSSILPLNPSLIPVP
jgi:hypothetical protein